MTNNKDDIIPIEVSQSVSPHNKALYEAGKKLLVESVSVGRDFCKFMTTTTLSAIPIYLALLKFFLPKDYSFTVLTDILFISPPIVFFISSLLFIIGYFPRKSKISLDIPSEVEQDIDNIIKHRIKWAIIAFTVFTIGIISSIILFIVKLSL